jgi:hypothetical protein
MSLLHVAMFMKGAAMRTVSTDSLREAFTAVLEEIHVGPPNPKTTWIATNAPDSGILGTLESIPADLASRPPGRGLTTIAAHAAHLLFALDLACRSMRGEDAYSGADWAADWKRSSVDEESWAKIKTGLRRAHTELLSALGADPPWGDASFLKGAIALIGHGAYHLGAIRQIRRFLASES